MKMDLKNLKVRLTFVALILMIFSNAECSNREIIINNLIYQEQKIYMNSAKPKATFFQVVHLSGEEPPKWVKGNFDGSQYRMIKRIDQYKGVSKCGGSFVVTIWNRSSRTFWGEKGEYYFDKSKKLALSRRLFTSYDFKYEISSTQLFEADGRKMNKTGFYINFHGETDPGKKVVKLQNNDKRVPKYKLPENVASMDGFFEAFKIPAGLR